MPGTFNDIYFVRYTNTDSKNKDLRCLKKILKNNDMTNLNNIRMLLKTSIRILAGFTFSLILQVQIYSQSTRNINNEISQLMTAIKTNQALPDISELYASEKKYTPIFEAASTYLTDTTYKVRLEAYKIIYTVALKTSDTELKSRSLEQFTNALSDQNSSISGYGARQLSVFDRESFSSLAKNNITDGINKGILRRAELIKMAGYLNIKDVENRIREEAVSAKKIEVRWAAYLALARMGDANYTNRVVNAVRKQGINDDVVYELVPDLIYTRQKACIDLAIEILFDEKKNCRSSNPDNPVKMQCGYRVVEYLAPIIADFPFEIRTSGDIETDNYEKALITVREWFLKKGNTYSILDNSY